MLDKDLAAELRSRKKELSAPAATFVDMLCMASAAYDLDYEEALTYNLEAHKFLLDFMSCIAEKDEQELSEVLKQAEEALKDA